jgi:hypothetical protein
VTAYVVTFAACQKWVRVWRDLWGLPSHYQITLRVFLAPEDAPEANRDAPAAIDIDDGFFRARLDVHAWAIESDAHLEWLVAHEIGHVPVYRIAALLPGTVPVNHADALEHDLINVAVRGMWLCKYGVEPWARTISPSAPEVSPAAPPATATNETPRRRRAKGAAG